MNFHVKRGPNVKNPQYNKICVSSLKNIKYLELSTLPWNDRVHDGAGPLYCGGCAYTRESPPLCNTSQPSADQRKIIVISQKNYTLDSTGSMVILERTKKRKFHTAVNILVLKML